jgi:hypothetical protein
MAHSETWAVCPHCNCALQLPMDVWGVHYWQLPRHGRMRHIFGTSFFVVCLGSGERATPHEL